MSLYTLMDSTAVLLRPTPVRDQVQGTVLNYNIINSNMPCSAQTGSSGTQALYAQQNIMDVANIIFTQNPLCLANDYLIINSFDGLSTNNWFQVLGNRRDHNRSISMPIPWMVDARRIQAPAGLTSSAFVEDTFVGTNGTIITGRNPAPLNLTGNLWKDFTAWNYPSNIIENGTAYAPLLTVTSEADNYINVGSPNVRVSFNFNMGAITDTFDTFGRVQNYTNQYYCLCYCDSGIPPFNVDAIGFFLFSSGTPIAKVPFTPTLQSYSIVALWMNSLFSLYINGVLILSGTMNSLLTSTQFGFGIGNTNAAQPLSSVTNFQVTPLNG
jgi:hypothetical protein